MMLNEIQSKQTSVNQWEELRRHARQHENELDTKLLALSKLGSRDVIRDEESNSDTSPLLGTSKDSFERICAEIDSLLTRLTEVNNEMSQCSAQMQNASAAMYTLQRHREILHDYNNEFHKTQNNIKSQMEREELLGTIKRDTGFKTNKKTDLYMKENEHIRSSENMVDEQINVAIRTRENLLNQRNAFKAIQTQMTTLANRFPMLNSLMYRINIKRRKDSIILGCVIALCMTFLILYIF